MNRVKGGKMATEVEKARQLLKALEMRNLKSRAENAIRLLCIQELLEESRRKIEIEN